MPAVSGSFSSNVKLPTALAVTGQSLRRPFCVGGHVPCWGASRNQLRGGSHLGSTFRPMLAGFSLFLFGLPSTICAQAVAVAQVSGSVLDPTGKAIVGAQVTMRDTERGQVRTA